VKEKNEKWLKSNQQFLNYKIFELLRKLDASFSGDQMLKFDKSNLLNDIESFHFSKLVQAFDLSSFEEDIILLAVGCELSSSFREALTKKLKLNEYSYLSFQNAFQLLENSHWDAIGPSGTLRKNNLIKLFDGEPFINRTFTIDETILQFLTGFSCIPTGLFQVSKVYNCKQPLVESHLVLSRYIDKYIYENSFTNIVGLYGDTKDKISIASHISNNRSCVLYIINAFSLPDSLDQICKLSYEWNRVSKLNKAILYLDCSSIEIQNTNNLKIVHQFLLNIESLVFIDLSSEANISLDNIMHVQVKKPTQTEQMKLWKEFFSTEALIKDFIEKVEQFNFTVGDIQNIINEYLIKADESMTNDEKQRILWETCSHFAKPKVHHLAYQLDIKASWDDLKLPAKTKYILQEVVNHVKYKAEIFETNGFNQKYSRNKGVSVLFTGESGTGKTMAAEVLANELQLNLFRIDLSQVINKYIGETEKNLKQIFDAAEAGGCILLFDEADAIFGKRSEVKDSHDRYSNIQVGYLLQRMEEFEGVAILTTNMKNSFDKAFERRIRFIVPFDRPDFEQRKLIWESVFPINTPIKDLDYDKLAKINLPGGNIKNIALHASFLAAANGKVVNMDHLATATMNEFAKMEKSISQNELKDWSCPKE